MSQFPKNCDIVSNPNDIMFVSNYSINGLMFVGIGFVVSGITDTAVGLYSSMSILRVDI